MSKPIAPRVLFPTVWIIAVAVVAAAVLAAGRAGFSRHGRVAAEVPAAMQSSGPGPEQRGQVRASLSALPLAFEENQGQTDPQVKYMARGNGYTVFLTSNDTVFALNSSAPGARASGRQELRTASQAIAQRAEKNTTAAIRMRLVGGSSHAQIAAGREMPGITNYFIGGDPSKWHAGVKHYSGVTYRDVYQGVNLAFHGEQRQLEFDFVVAAGASPAPIHLGFSGARKMATDATGNLLLSSAAGDVVLHKPVAYQERDGRRQVVDVAFQMKSKDEVGFALGSYDHGRELVIDPSIEFATYLGGSGEDDGYGAAFDSFGNIYVTGQTASTDFPTAGGVAPNKNAGSFDVFVTKISPDGSTLIYSTYVGGSGSDSGTAIAADALGNAFVAGGTTSTDFPHNGGFQSALGGTLDAFVFELNPAGTALTYSTYLGGSGDDSALGIAIDGSDHVYVVGSTFSTDFPTLNPIQSSIAGSSNGFVTKLSNTGNALIYSTYLGGGSGDFAAAVAVDSAGRAYVTGGTPNPAFPTTSGAFQTSCGSDGTCNGGLPDAFVTVINSAGSSFIYSTFLGGEGIDQGLGVAVDAAGDAYVTGLTQSSTHFPLKSSLQSYGGSQDAFVTELNPSGTALIYSTYLGGSLDDAGSSIAVDESNNAYVTGRTHSANFPTSSNASQPLPGGGADAFVSEIAASGSQLVFSTYLGGLLDENTHSSGGILSPLGALAVEESGANIYVTGNTASTDFPTKAAKQATSGGGTDAFLVRYNVSTAPDFQIAATTPAAVAQGGSGTSTVTLTSLNAYSQSVTLVCRVTGSGSPLPACSASNAFSTNPVTPTSGGATSTLTITTTGKTAALYHPSKIFYALWLPIVGLSLAGMRLSATGSRRKRLLGFMLLGVVTAMLFFLPACSSSSGGGGGGGGGCPGCTPTGNYTVTITGTDASNLAHSTQVTLAVN